MLLQNYNFVTKFINEFHLFITLIINPLEFKIMLSYWLIVFSIIAISALFVTIVKFIFRNTNYLKRISNLFLLFVLPALSLYIYVTFACTNICVVEDNEIASRYIKLYSTTYKLKNGGLLDLDNQNPRYSCFVINNTSTPLLFDLIGYSKKGNTSIEYGHKDILPYSIDSVTQYPDFIFSDPPNEVFVSSAKYAAENLTIKGWLHKN